MAAQKTCVKWLVENSLQEKLPTHATASDSAVFCRVSCPFKGNGLLAYEALLGHTHMFCRHQSKSVHPVLLGFLENNFDWRDIFWPVLPHCRHLMGQRACRIHGTKLKGFRRLLEH